MGDLKKVLTNVKTRGVWGEVRLRAGRPVAVWYNGEEWFLTRAGVSRSSERAIACGADDVRSSVMGASEHSVYAYNDDIGRGFITVGGGVRLGICGEVVTDSGRILTVKNYSSVNIRIPHEILGISRCIMPDIISKAMNILVISPPGGGKGGQPAGHGAGHLCRCSPPGWDA